MAAGRKLPEVAAIGMELCGTYAPVPEIEAGMRSRVPLSSKELLTAYCDKAIGAPGVKIARKALSYVVDSSASPKETSLTLLLCLPGFLGGYHLPFPLLNPRIDVGKYVRGLANKGYYRCDLYWPEAKLAIEYESNSHHTGPIHIADDSKRRNAIEELGIHIVTVTWAQTRDAQELDKVAHIIARRLGKPLRNQDYDIWARRYDLRKRLLGTHGL